MSSARVYLDSRGVFNTLRAVETSSISRALANTPRYFCCSCSACVIVHASFLKVIIELYRKINVTKLTIIIMGIVIKTLFVVSEAIVAWLGS